MHWEIWRVVEGRGGKRGVRGRKAAVVDAAANSVDDDGGGGGG
jgi:hypothetical protein